MLVLSRKKGQYIIIGENIKVTILDVGEDRVNFHTLTPLLLIAAPSSPTLYYSDNPFVHLFFIIILFVMLDTFFESISTISTDSPHLRWKFLKILALP
jgi:hypothetical protein